MGRSVKAVIVLFVIALIGIQFVKVDRHNPPVTAEINAPAQVMNVIKTSCYDCHSNETKWPWYSYIAPVSWFIESDVHEGRKHLNFSEWNNYTDQKKAKKKHDIWEEVNGGDMPLTTYTYLHPNSTLDVQKKSIIQEWATRRSIWDQ